MLIRVDGPHNRHAVISVVCLLKSNTAQMDSTGVSVSLPSLPPPSFLPLPLSSPSPSLPPLFYCVYLCSLWCLTTWLKMATTNTTISHCSPRRGRAVTCKLTPLPFPFTPCTCIGRGLVIWLCAFSPPLPFPLPISPLSPIFPSLLLSFLTSHPFLSLFRHSHSCVSSQ